MSASEILFNTTATEQYLLLQLTDPLLHKRLFIKPAGPNATMLCTESATFLLKDVQQSNSLMFLGSTGNGGDLEVKGEAASWLETTLTPNPRVDVSKIPIYDGTGSADGIDKETLFASIPASSAEIGAALRRLVCVDAGQGYVRLDSAYVSRVLRTLIVSAAANRLDLSNSTTESVLAAMQDENEDKLVTDFIFNRFSNSLQSANPGKQARSVDPLEVVKFTGMTTLELHAQTPITSTKFLALWNQCTPVPYQSYCNDLNLLAGHYIQPVSTQIMHFDSSKLPLDAKERMARLLAAKDRWSEKDLSPFLSEIAGGPKDIQAIILKHAKRVRIGQTTFVERRGK